MNENERPRVGPIIGALRGYQYVEDRPRGVPYYIRVGAEIISSYQNDTLVPNFVAESFDNVSTELWDTGILTDICNCEYHRNMAIQFRQIISRSNRARVALELTGARSDLLFQAGVNCVSDDTICFSHIMPVRQFVELFVDCPIEQQWYKIDLIISEMRPTTDEDVKLRTARRRRRALFTGIDPLIRLRGDFKRWDLCQVPVTYGVPTQSLDEDEDLRNRLNTEILLCRLGLPFNGSQADGGKRYYLEVQYHLSGPIACLPTAVESRGNWFWMPKRAAVGGNTYNFTRDVQEILTKRSTGARDRRIFELLPSARSPGLPEVIHKPFRIGPDSVDDILVWRTPVNRSWIEYASGN